MLKGGAGGEPDKVQDLFLAYKADQEELNEKNRKKQEKLKNRLEEEKEKSFRLECELSGLQGVLMQLEQDAMSMQDKLRRKEDIIEDLYERRA